MSNTPNVSNAASISVNNFSGGGNGLDATMAIQLLLMKDCDEQLKDVGSQMKITQKLKKCYREDIQKQQALLMRPTVDKKGKESTKDDGAMIKMSAEEFKLYNVGTKYAPDEITGQPKAYPSTDMGKLLKDPKSTSSGDYLVPKKNIETRIEILNGEKDTLNEQSEQFSLQVQAITNLRKSALETTTNVMSKQNEGLSTIIRNYRS